MIQQNPIGLQIDQIDDYRESAMADKPDWVKALSRSGHSRFNAAGIPTVKDEEWKYTNIKFLAGQSFRPAAAVDYQPAAFLKSYLNPDDINLVFVNGVLHEKLSHTGKAPEGVTIRPWESAVQENAAEIQAVLNRYDPDRLTSFEALHESLNNGGLFIDIAKGAVCPRLIHVVHIAVADEGNIIQTPRLLVHARESSEVRVLESYLGGSNQATVLTNALTDIELKENAVVHYCKAQSEERRGVHIGRTRVWQARNSNLQGFSLAVGAAICRNDLNIILDGEGISTTLNGLYCVNADQHIDNHTAVDHRFPNCNSTQLYKGILSDSSRAVFNGKIFVKPVAQLTNSYQLNKNLLLGKDCRVDTKPQLEIFADDVKCTHGATIGQLNPDELFYLETRGIGKKDAITMLSRGFVDDILDRIGKEDVVAKMNILLEPTFEALSA